MREIKFRAWDKTLKMWTIPFTIFDICTGEFFNDLTKDGYNIVQYTGLKDKNGKEIYEGDILSDGDRIGKVIFNHGAFVVKYKEISNWKLLNKGGKMNKEIIGNIYQNSDLLNN